MCKSCRCYFKNTSQIGVFSTMFTTQMSQTAITFSLVYLIFSQLHNRPILLKYTSQNFLLSPNHRFKFEVFLVVGHVLTPGISVTSLSTFLQLFCSTPVTVASLTVLEHTKQDSTMKLCTYCLSLQIFTWWSSLIPSDLCLNGIITMEEAFFDLLKIATLPLSLFLPALTMP